MAVSDSDIVFYKSATGASEGGAISATPILDEVDNNLWADISDSERIAGFTKYRKWFVTNEHSTDTMLLPVCWIEQAPTGTTESLGVGWNSTDDDATDAGNMTAWGANAALAAVSDGADTRSLTILGVDNAGVPVQVSLTLTGTTEAVTPTVFSKVYSVRADAESARTVTIRQGAAGTTRGTISPNRLCCFLWLSPASKAAGIALPNLVAGGSYAFWDRIVGTAGISAQRPTDSLIGFEEA